MVSALMFTMMLATADVPDMMVPEGTVLPVVLNERISTKTVQENDPILFSLADDIRAGGHRGIVLIPRGSSVVGRVIRTDRAGHFIGRATIDIRMEKIVTPRGDVYDGLTAKVVDLSNNKGRKGQVRADGEIEGPVHRKRDAFFLLFPPTTIFQLLALPARGPDVVLPPETRLYVKLMTPIYVERQVAQQTMPLPAPVPQSMAVPAPQAVPSPGPVPMMLPMPIPIPQPAQAVRYLSWNELNLLVARVAMYPDTLLYSVLTACRYPDQLVDAARWIDRGGNVILVTQQWDPSVRRVAMYPEVLRSISADTQWMILVGNAYTVQRAEVVSAVQRVRMFR